MILSRRVWTIFAKELIDILRDHRTLIAMIVVPIVLYPLLTLGSLQAVSQQRSRLADETLVIGVLREADAAALDDLLRADERHVARLRERADPREPKEPFAQPIREARVRLLDSPERLVGAIRDREIHLGVLLPEEGLRAAPDATNRIEIVAAMEDVRSMAASRRMTAMFDRTREREVRRRLVQLDLPETFVRPIEVDTTDISQPESMLGYILPLVLVLMTITGAIYPAIDLTAGERERNTLESLMACPVSTVDLIVGKFLVVSTVALMGAALNLASVSATAYFGGLADVLWHGGGGLPIGRMVFILIAMVPFAVLMSAVMIAVCSFARTFKEAQNYVTPVILAVLVPGGIAAFPTSQLEGIMLVLPVGNMVLLSREILVGVAVPAWKLLTVLISTTLYAGAAVAVATQLFGREAVVFSDSASLRTALSRRLIRPSLRPSGSLALLCTALLFPAWFFVQMSIQPEPGGDMGDVLRSTAFLMPLMFVVLPVLLMLYGKVDVVHTLRLKAPSAAHLAAGALIGVTAWIPAFELNVAQQHVLTMPDLGEYNRQLVEALRHMGWPMALLTAALVPAVCEEALFRGFLLTGLGGSGRRWSIILASAAVFAIFHFVLFKLAVTFLLGVLLGYLCLQSRSLLPGIVAHALHNGLTVSLVFWPEMLTALGIAEDAEAGHLPLPLLMAGGAGLGLGLWLLVRFRSASSECSAAG